MKKAAANASLSVLSQGLSSLTNMAAAVGAAQAMSTSEFGKFSVALLIYAVVVPGVQALVSQELVLTTGTSEERSARARDALLFSVVVVAAVGAAIAVFSVVLAPDLETVLVPLGLLLPLLQLQDTARFAAATTLNMRLAVASDGLWFLLTVGSTVLLRASGSSSAAAFLIAWCISGSFAGLAVLKPFVSGPRPSVSLARFAERHFLGYRFLGEFLALRASSQILTVLLGVIAGYAATGGLRGATVLFGPLTVLVLAASSFGVPIVYSAPPASREKVLGLLAVSLVGLCLVLTIGVGEIPREWGKHLLGDTWGAAMRFVWPVGAQLMLTSVSTTFFLALRMLSPRSTLKLRVVPAAMMPLAFFVGLFLGGPTGAAWGITLGSALQCLIAGRAYLLIRSGSGGLAALS